MYVGPSTCNPVTSPPLACTEMNLTFYDVLKLRKAIKFKKYFDQECYVPCFATFFSPVISPQVPQPPHPPLTKLQGRMGQIYNWYSAKKKTTWFIGVEVEQETSAPPSKKKSWIRP